MAEARLPGGTSLSPIGIFSLYKDRCRQFKWYLHMYILTINDPTGEEGLLEEACATVVTSTTALPKSCICQESMYRSMK